MPSMLLSLCLSLQLMPMSASELDDAALGRFAHLALDCVERQYPNKIAHVLNGPDDVGAPQALTPAFYGCFDWHSAVHGHWLLTRLLRLRPEAEWAPAAREALGRNLTPEHIAVELAYIQGERRATFERPYGLAWLLQLARELAEWEDEDAARWSAALAPLEVAAADRFYEWLPKLVYPIRTGEHSQSAFALGLVHDWAKVRGNNAMLELVREKALGFHLDDRDCPLGYEPSGQDFLSPCLAEADLMRRVLEPDEFAQWLTGFLPQIPEDGGSDWLPVGIVSDRSDGKLAHLDGLNLSRAWMLQGMVAALPPSDRRVAALRAAMNTHRASGLSAVGSEHYEGGHWLGSFAVYLVTGTGL